MGNLIIDKTILLKMDICLLVCIGFMLLPIPTLQGQNPDIPVNFDKYDELSGILISAEKGLITAKWNGNDRTNYVTFRIESFLDKDGMSPQPPLIQSIGVIENETEKKIFSELQPEYALFLGERDLKKRNGWQIFFDYPYKRSYSVQKAILDTKNVNVSSTGNRATISFEGLKGGEFEGDLNFTFYSGDALIKMEAAMATDQDARAYLYHAGLSTLGDDVKNICWQDNTDKFIRQSAHSEFATPKTTRYRTIIAESENGALATFPSPHRFIPPLDGVGNYGYNWSGQNYLDLFNGYGWGVRQPVFGDRRQVPWLNAPPGSVQKMGFFLYLDDQKAEAVLEKIKKYTHGDQFVDIPGYKKFTSHYHVEHSLDYINKQKEQNTTEIPKGLENPEFAQFFKKMGVDIVHLGEFHVGETPGLGTDERLAQLQVMHEECERLSNNNFLLLPGEEPNVQLGGHWMSFFPKPIYWVLNNPDKKPFVEKSKTYGKVYHVGSSADVLELFEKENGLMWVAHGRIKGSTGFPDEYKEEDYFTSNRYLGAAWKNMPSDLSEEKMGNRVFGLLDDMNNWGLKKQALGEVDVFDIQNDYELYGAMNINYLKLDKLPDFKYGWQPVLDVLRNGNFWVGTGEILLKDFTINDKECGSTLKLKKGQTAKLKADLEWTFPLRYVEVVTGDGAQVERQRVDLSDTKSFGNKEFEMDLNLDDSTWVRFEVWDIADNVAFTQPIWVESK
ncbi:hypothetical protein [Pricia sp.]|uniref:hypothetical protein n=1 Tax=Pricia sp. TaxID=2268138 RepID=UPI00359356B6